MTVKLFWIKIESLFWITFGNTDCSKTTAERDPELCGFVPFLLQLYIQDPSVPGRKIRITHCLLLYLSFFVHTSYSVNCRQHKVSLNIIMTFKRMNEKSSEERPAEQLVKWEVVWVLVGSAAPGYHRPQTLSPVKTNIFTQGRATTAWRNRAGGWMEV